jgi:alternate signal-mediated exported protein
MTAITTPTTSRDNRSRRRKALIAAISGGALLLGGSTFALWSQSVNVAGNSVNTGKFALAETPGQPKMAYDVSEDRTDGTDTQIVLGLTKKAHEVSPEALTAYGLTPGDKLWIKVPLTITLTGDNMVAKLVGDSSGMSTTTEALEKIRFTWTVYNASTGTILGNATGTGAAAANFGSFAAKAFASVGPDTAATTVLTGDSLDVVAVAEVYLPPADFAGIDGVDATINLDAVKFTLSQTRTGGAGDFKS